MKKCCLRTCITAFVFIAIIVIGVVVLLNLTPAQLHLADKSIAGYSMADYGLGDVKLIKIFKGFRGLGKKEAKVVSHAYDATAEKTAAEALFAGSNYASTEDYSELVVTDAVYDQRYLRGAADTTLAYVMENVLSKAYVVGSGDNATAAMSVREVTIIKAENTSGSIGHMRVVIGVSTANFIGNLDAIKNVLDKIKIIKIPQYVFVVCEADFTVGTVGTEEGKIMFQNFSANIAGDADNALNGLFLSFVNRAMGEDSSDAAQNGTVFGTAIFDKVAAAINHIGQIGVANTTTDGQFIVAGEVTHGMSGVAEGKLFFVTKKS